MKKVLLFGILLFVMSLSASSQITDKALKKEYKETLKRFRKEGWKVYASSQSLDEGFERYYTKRQNEGGTPILGRGDGSNNNMANTKARVEAVREYASQLETKIEAETRISLSGAEDAQHFRSIVKSKTEQCIRGMSPVLSLSRKVDSGKYEMLLYYLVDVDKEIAKIEEEMQAMQTTE